MSARELSLNFGMLHDHFGPLEDPGFSIEMVKREAPLPSREKTMTGMPHSKQSSELK